MARNKQLTDACRHPPALATYDVVRRDLVASDVILASSGVRRPPVGSSGIWQGPMAFGMILASGGVQRGSVGSGEVRWLLA